MARREARRPHAQRAGRRRRRESGGARGPRDGAGRPLIAPAPRPAPARSLAPALELAALGAGLTLATGALAARPSWYRELGAFQALYAVAFAFYALAVARLPRFAAVPRAGAAVFAVACACRVLLLPLPPSLSGDLFRYVWEGRVWVHGGNPYHSAPAAPELAALRDAAVHPFVNHPHLATIYPPLAEAGFALVAAVSATPLAMKVWIALHDLALVAVLLAWARATRGAAALALIYAWNPLVLVEYAGTGHHDPTALLPLALAFHLRSRRPALSALALAWAALVKLAPLLALPFLWRGWPPRARWTAALALLPGLALYAALTRAGDSGLAAYWQHWRNNELVFHLAERALGSFGAARLATLAVVAAVVVWALARRLAPDHAARRTLATALLTSPVVHPWYAGWLVMFVTPPLSVYLLALTALLPLGYGWLATPAEGRSFHAPLAWRAIEYGLPLLAALGAAALQRRRRRARVP